MTRVSPNLCQIGHQPTIHSHTIGSPISRLYGVSTLRSENKQGIFSTIRNALLCPIKLVWKWTMIVIWDYLFFWVPCGCRKEVLNWQATKEIFAGIYTAVITSTTNESDRIKKFNEAFVQLTSGAKEQFRKHVGFVLAERESPKITELAEKEKFYAENCGKDEKCSRGTIKKKYFSNISNTVLKEAVRNFQKELLSKTSN